MSSVLKHNQLQQKYIFCSSYLKFTMCTIHWQCCWLPVFWECREGNLLFIGQAGMVICRRLSKWLNISLLIILPDISVYSNNVPTVPGEAHLCWVFMASYLLVNNDNAQSSHIEALRNHMWLSYSTRLRNPFSLPLGPRSELSAFGVVEA